MSYSYSFSQYPTKQVDELWEKLFSDELMGYRMKDADRVEAELREAERLPFLKSDTSDFEIRRMKMQERERYDALVENGERVYRLKAELRTLNGLREAIVDVANAILFIERDGREKVLEKVTALSDAMVQLVGKECQSFGESTRDNDYRFLDQLYERVTGTFLTEVKRELTTQDWVAFFRSLSKELILEELNKMYAEDHIPAERQAEARGWYTDLLFRVRDMLKECLEKGWDLHSYVEYWCMDTQELFWEESMRKRHEMYTDRVIKAFPDFG